MKQAPTPETIERGRLYRDRRLALGVSQGWLAAYSGLAYKTIVRIEEGNPSTPKSVAALATVLNALELQKRVAPAEPPPGERVTSGVCQHCGQAYERADIDIKNWLLRQLICPRCEAVVGRLK